MNEKKRELTIKQKRFVQEYVKDGNGSRAIIDAGYHTTPEVAKSMATENLAKPNVRERVERALAALDIDESYVLNGFKQLAEKSRVDMAKARALENLGSIADLYPKSGTQLDIEDGKLSIKWKD
jgi:phage terminase small subunit